MKTSITNKLIEFYNTQTNVSENITEDQYRSAILSTIDTETGEKLNTFTLTTPTTDISISSGEIGVLGAVTFV